MAGQTDWCPLTSCTVLKFLQTCLQMFVLFTDVCSVCVCTGGVSLYRDLCFRSSVVNLLFKLTVLFMNLF